MAVQLEKTFWRYSDAEANKKIALHGIIGAMDPDPEVKKDDWPLVLPELRRLEVDGLDPHVGLFCLLDNLMYSRKRLDVSFKEKIDIDAPPHDLEGLFQVASAFPITLNLKVNNLICGVPNETYLCQLTLILGHFSQKYKVDASFIERTNLTLRGETGVVSVKYTGFFSRLGATPQ